MKMFDILHKFRSKKRILRNSESVLILILGDDDGAVRNKDMSQVLALRKNNTSFCLFHFQP